MNPLYLGLMLALALGEFCFWMLAVFAAFGAVSWWWALPAIPSALMADRSYEQVARKAGLR